MPHLDNVVAFWNLASDSTDQSGGGRNGSDGASVSYDGSKATFSNVVTSTISFTNLVTSTTFTVAFWINAGSPGDFQAILTGTSVDGLYVMADGKLMLYSGSASGESSSVISGALHSVVVSVNAGAATFYIDGVAAGTVASYPSITLNRFGYDGANQVMIGTLQSVGVYSVAKDVAWAVEEYNGGTPKTYTQWSATVPGGGAALLMGLGGLSISI